MPGDPNISIVQRVTPYTNVDNYAGAQKKLDAILVADSVIRLRYYLKTRAKTGFFQGPRRQARGAGRFHGPEPARQPLGDAELSLAELSGQNPGVKDKTVMVTGLAFLAKFPQADPAMPIYLGLDDIVFEGARTPDFRFIEPAVHKLAEWRPYIPQRLFARGEMFNLRGEWPVTAGSVSVRIAPFADREKTVLDTRLKKSGAEWRLAPVRLDWTEGLYFAELTARRGREDCRNNGIHSLHRPAEPSGKAPAALV